jgi:hypothetical protein
MKRPIAIWTRYDDGSIDYCLVNKPFFVPKGSIVTGLEPAPGELTWMPNGPLIETEEKRKWNTLLVGLSGLGLSWLGLRTLFTVLQKRLGGFSLLERCSSLLVSSTASASGSAGGKKETKT